MKWKIDFSKTVEKQFSNLSHDNKIRIAAYLKSRINTSEDPRRFGKPLVGEFSGCWRYRVGDYRLICKIQDHQLLVLVLELARIFHTSQSAAWPKPMNTALSLNFDQSGMDSYSPDQNPASALSHQLFPSLRCENHEISGLGYRRDVYD